MHVQGGYEGRTEDANGRDQKTDEPLNQPQSGEDLADRVVARGVDRPQEYSINCDNGADHYHRDIATEGLVRRLPREGPEGLVVHGLDFG